MIFDIETAAADNAREFCKEPKDKRSKSIEDQLEDAALSAITGKVLAIGALDGSEPHLFHGEDEAAVLMDWWAFYRERHAPGNTDNWIGFNIVGFDLPFLWRRSIVNGIKPPMLFNDRGYALPHFVDLRVLWGCGDRYADGSLDVIARLCGLPGKTGGGAEFAKLYRADETRQQALDYLINDLLVTKQIAKRMGVL
jgi:hypothetical protein